MIRNRARSFDVRLEAQDDFNDHVRKYMEGMVWTGTCRSWCKFHTPPIIIAQESHIMAVKNGSNGKITALWPGSGLHYMQCLAEDRWEDYAWEYHGERYAYWNRGFSWIEKPEMDPLGLQAVKSVQQMNTIPQPASDLSFYIGEAKYISRSELELEQLDGCETTQASLLSKKLYDVVSGSENESNGFLAEAVSLEKCILQAT